MCSYYLLQMTVKDAEKLRQYTDAAPATVGEFGGELIFRSNVSDVLSLMPEHTAAVVLKFQNQASAKAWYESKNYQNLLEFRDAGADVVVTRYDEADFF